MAISLADLQTTQVKKPPRLLIYGPPGLGKTSLAAEFPDPVIIDVEDGTPVDVHIPTFGLIEDFGQVMTALQELYNQDHPYKTLIVDSMDRLEPHVWQDVCSRHGKSSIEDFGYGKGYVEAAYSWQSFFDWCNALRRDKNMTIVFIAHSTINRFEDPLAPSYSTYDIRLHKNATAKIQDEVDAIFFLNQDMTIQEEDAGFNKSRARAEGAGVVWIYTERRPAFTAKNRFGMPDRVLYNKGQGYSAIAPFLPTHTAPESVDQAHAAA